ncbi:dihydrofolate reductase family protein [Pseudoduganella sp. S-14]|jgi:dihydrofolate reductase|uniref:dihydrofolate reductase family protein n=1 Tax=Pseudoduganella sp. S-14 TaxID=3404065 RepID=UPI003CEF1F33
MKKLILQMQMSVDGLVAASDTKRQWQLWDWGDSWVWDDELKNDFNQAFVSVDTILLSRKMLEQGYLAHWASAAARFPQSRHYAFARKVAEMNKVVITDKLREPPPGERIAIAAGGLVREVNALKRQSGQDMIAFGGAGFAGALACAGLVDEFQFFINPTVIGAGKSIFGNMPAGQTLSLLDSKRYACGIVVNRYAPS